MSKNLENLKNDLTAILTSYGQINPDILNHMAAYPDWQIHAERQLMWSGFFLMKNVLKNLPIEALTAVANGKLDIAQLVAEAGQALDAEEGAKATA